MLKYLALGDSYTIGEKVDYQDNFPSQVCQLLQQHKVDIRLEKLIAVTGYTSDELALAIEKEKPALDYDWVSLLIGVNNQYRGSSLEEYRWQFYGLLCQAILFAKSNSSKVIVLTIPDWGLTPFNQDRDKQITSQAIDAFNHINKEITLAMNCQYIDITTSTREHALDRHFLAEDLLHYSKHEYAIWAKEIAQLILEHR